MYGAASRGAAGVTIFYQQVLQRGVVGHRLGRHMRIYKTARNQDPLSAPKRDPLLGGWAAMRVALSQRSASPRVSRRRLRCGAEGGRE